MKKFYSIVLMALVAMMMPVAAEAQVTINELRGTYVFHGVANDWTGYGVVPPTASTVTLSINEEDNTVSMTGFLGTEVIIWGEAEDGSEDIYDALHGTFDPETQKITFLDNDNESSDFFTLSDDYYDWYIYNLVFQASKDEEGNVVLDMVPAENNSLCIIQTYYYDETEGYVYVNYGFDQGGRMTQLSANAKSYIGSLEPGNYEIIYTDRDDQQGMMPATVAAGEDGSLTLTTNEATVALEAQTSGRGENKYTYAYKTNGCYDTYYFWGEGEDDYEYHLVPQYWGQNELTLYFNGEEPMVFSTGIWFGIGESGKSVFNCVLAKEGTFADGIEAITETGSNDIQYFDLQGRRISQPRGITIVKRNGSVRKMLMK